jgi:hypothetical protein
LVFVDQVFSPIKFQGVQTYDLEVCTTAIAKDRLAHPGPLVKIDPLGTIQTVRESHDSYTSLLPIVLIFVDIIPLFCSLDVGPIKVGGILADDYQIHITVST